MNSSVSRRSFLLAAASLGVYPEGAMAGPFSSNQDDFDRLIPADKKLLPEWTASLFARGTPTTYRKSRGELNFIGMPVGGLTCGTLYLGGDGKLWLWDIFNQPHEGVVSKRAIVPLVVWGGGNEIGPRDGVSYVEPNRQQSPLSQGFSVRVDGIVRSLNAASWDEVEFTGEYPIGTVTYTDPSVPVTVKLEAYSPFLPLHLDDSSLPTTVVEITLTNTSKNTVKAQVGGWLENACNLFSAKPGMGERVNILQVSSRSVALVSLLSRNSSLLESVRPDVVLDRFDRSVWAPWTATGTAFGSGPVLRSAVPSYQGELGGESASVVNSHASAPGASIAEKDGATGVLTSTPFTIERKFLAFWIGGGANIEEVGIRLLIDGKTVRRATGKNANQMHRDAFNVIEFAGKQATLEIYDLARGAWGNIGVSEIVQTDDPKLEAPLDKAHDAGTMAFAMLGGANVLPNVTPETLYTTKESVDARRPIGEPLIGGLTSEEYKLGAKKSVTVTFVITWHFPNSAINTPDAAGGNHYAARFSDAGAVLDYVTANLPRFSQQTKLFRETFYGGTLPHWFLERTIANTSTLATTTCHRFKNGRFWAWEGVGCCEGTCTHVWHYAQAPGRLFPELERDHRERVDFGAAFDDTTGLIGYRGEQTGAAVDGQCGRILGVWREHTMSANSDFLTKLWPKVKKAVLFLIRHDSNNDGLLDGAQENTLDAAWFGKIAWLSSLYAAALRAAEQMALEMGDSAFAAECRQRAAQTATAIERELWNGEFFIQRPEVGHERSLGTYETCHIDQVHGQSWAWQVGLGRVLDREKTVTALKSLYKYNFAPDVGPFRQKNRAGRPYAMPGDAGLILSTNPKGIKDAFGNAKDWQFGYFNECMTGFEHQAASHMIAEGMLLEGLAVTRAIHDRYHAKKRNPFNEIECSDHYARAMASYGSLISITGFEYHGPSGVLTFAPRITPDNFQAPFTTAEGWGSYAQVRTEKTTTLTLAIKSGRLRLTKLGGTLPLNNPEIRVGRKQLTAQISQRAGQTILAFSEPLVLLAGQTVVITEKA